MRYRKLDQNGDYTFGNGSGNFYQDQPEAVAQAVLTRLKLIQGEWSLDVTKGTPYNTEILGMGTLATYDQAFQQVILETQGVTGIADYASAFDPITRHVKVAATINTVFGATTIQATL